MMIIKKPLSDETKAKISVANKTRYNGPNGEKYRKHVSLVHTGKIVTQETREKLSLAFKNKHHTNPRSPEYCAKMSKSLTGKHLSDETKNKLSKINTDENHPKYGKPVSKETREKISKANTGRKHTPETILKLSGENGSNWKGGISFEPYCMLFNNDLKNRIRAFFNHECTLCNKSTEENKQRLSCHHVEYNKDACCDGKPVQFAALCKICHNKTGSDRTHWEAILHRIISEIYGDRSYFTKKEMKIFDISGV